MSQSIYMYTSDVMHRRNFPQRYRFDYRVASLLIDIDHIDEAVKASPFLSLNRFNLYSIYTKDHGYRDGREWRSWIDAKLDHFGVDKGKHKIKLLCFPRILGYAFNPLCLWYCYGEDQQLYAIVCEVRNTFGEHHHYVLHNDNKPYSEKITARKNKQFHVSPFISMNAEYQFILKSPDQKLSIIINEYQNNDLMLTATQMGERKQVSTSQLLYQFVRLPFMSFKIMAMIHWQALKIWLRGGKFHKKPNLPEQDFS